MLRGRYIYFHCNHAKSHVYHVRKSIYCTDGSNTLCTAELLKAHGCVPLISEWSWCIVRVDRGRIFGRMPEEAASIFGRVSINLVTIICGVVYGARNRRTVHLFSHFLLRAKLKVFSMFLLKCLLLCIFQFNSTWQACFTNNILSRGASSSLNYFCISLKDAFDVLFW